MSRKSTNELDRIINECLSGNYKDNLTSVEVRWLAICHLLAKGCKGYSDFIEVELENGDWFIYFEAPGAILGVLTSTRLLLQRLSNINIGIGDYEDKYEGTPLKAKLNGIACDFNEKQFENDSFYRKRVAAASLLETFAKGFVANMTDYRINKETFNLEKTPTQARILGQVIDYAIIGDRFNQCPACSGLVFMPRKTSTPFCSPACQTSYYRNAQAKALDMAHEGKNADDIVSQFPYVKPKTVMSWLKRIGI